MRFEKALKSLNVFGNPQPFPGHMMPAITEGSDARRYISDGISGRKLDRYHAVRVQRQPEFAGGDRVATAEIE
jgi:hypothetical protein